MSYENPLDLIRSMNEQNKSKDKAKEDEQNNAKEEESKNLKSEDLAKNQELIDRERVIY